MTNDRPQLGPDEWSAWLLEHRHGRDPVVEKALRTEVAGYVGRILDAAQLEPAMTLADVGTGDGVVAFRAIERVGPSLRVLMADISAPLLRHAESLAAQRNVRNARSFRRLLMTSPPSQMLVSMSLRHGPRSPTLPTSVQRCESSTEFYAQAAASTLPSRFCKTMPSRRSA